MVFRINTADFLRKCVAPRLNPHFTYHWPIPLPRSSARATSLDWCTTRVKATDRWLPDSCVPPHLCLAKLTFWKSIFSPVLKVTALDFPGPLLRTHHRDTQGLTYKVTSLLEAPSYPPRTRWSDGFILYISIRLSHTKSVPRVDTSGLECSGLELDCLAAT
jgi:hypothetical protein